MLEEVARTVRARVEEALDDTGLRWDHVAVLSVLAAAKAVPQPVLRERTGIDRTTLGAVLADLEEYALVERRRDTGDSRQVVTQVTPRGRQAAAHAEGLLAGAEREALRPLRPAEQRRLHELLARLLPAERPPLAGLLD